MEETSGRCKPTEKYLICDSSKTVLENLIDPLVPIISCTHKHIELTVVQIRSNDEPETYIYVCQDCKRIVKGL